MISSRVFIFVLTQLQAALLFTDDSSAESASISIPPPLHYTSKPLQVFALPVGQGDCTIIQCPNGGIVVFDCGSRGYLNQRWFPNDVQNWLANTVVNGIDRVVAILVTHPDEDHYNYLPSPDIQWNYDNTEGVVFAGKFSKYSNDMQVWLNNWNERGKLFVVVEPQDSRSKCIGDCVVRNKFDQPLSIDFCKDQDIQFHILAANAAEPPKPNQKRKDNEDSIVLKIVVGQWSMLLSGDMEGAASIEIARTLGYHLKSDVYKMSHHGASLKANQFEWLNQIKPQSAFTSSAFCFGNCYHPRCDTIARLQFLGTITRTGPHKFYCAYSDKSYINGDFFDKNMWETTPDGNHICLLTYVSPNIEPQLSCQYIYTDSDDADDDDIDDDDVDDDDCDVNDDDDVDDDDCDVEDTEQRDFPDGSMMDEKL